MKKIYTLLLASCALAAQAQNTQRLTLVEQFTQASCGPCASQNPAFNALLDANTSKVVSIKYQTDWPGVDPMNAQNPAQVDTRVAYYGVSGVPHIAFDGNVNIGGTAPSSLSQTEINTEYAVAAPFQMDLTHTVSTDFDSIFITAIITANQTVTFTAGALRAHIVLVEKEIKFATAPGTNGETEFFSVMRKMLPSDQGTTLVQNWNAGDDDTITFAVAIPSYIYDKSQLAVVGFIQNNTNKAVQQAAFSEPIPLTLDAGVSAITNIPILQCTNSITPTVTIKNFASTTLTSLTINYKIDNGTTMTENWTGTLAAGATTTVTLPALTVTNGSHTFTASTSAPNGGVDYNTYYDSQNKSFNIFLTPVAAPLTQGFQSSTFPPSGWAINNPDNGPTWMKKTGAGGFLATSSAISAKLDFYNSPSGNVDEFYAPAFSLTGATPPVTLDFNVAYAGYTAGSPENDQLDVEISTDCGATWTNLYSKAGDNLKTGAPKTSAYTPTASEWRAESIDLVNYAGQANLLVKFKGTSDYGNNLYIDDVNIHSTTGIVSLNGKEGFSIAPNPAKTETVITVTLNETAQVNVELFNALGQSVLSIKNQTLAQGESKINVNLSSLNSGIYFCKLNTGKETITKRIVIE